MEGPLDETTLKPPEVVEALRKFNDAFRTLYYGDQQAGTSTSSSAGEASSVVAAILSSMSSSSSSDSSKPDESKETDGTQDQDTKGKDGAGTGKFVLQVGPELEQVLEQMRFTGVPIYEWDDIKGLLSYYLIRRTAEFHERFKDTEALNDSRGNSFEDQRERLLQSLMAFDGAPFTLQRLCELLLHPTENYKSTKKLLYGLEKLLSVSTTLDVATPEDVKYLQEDYQALKEKHRTADLEQQQYQNENEMQARIDPSDSIDPGRRSEDTHMEVDSSENVDADAEMKDVSS